MHLNHPPTKPYNGLTIILSNPSRFDLRTNPPQLLSGVAGECVKKYFFGPDVDLARCHIFDIYEEKDPTKLPILPATRAVILMGSGARNLIFPTLANYSVNAQRGGVYFMDTYKDIPFILTYSPQDTFDPVELEASNNYLLETTNRDGDPTSGAATDTSTADEDEGGSDKDHSPTSRHNWRFWLEQDIKKAKKILYFGIPKEDDITTHIYPNEVIIWDFFDKLDKDGGNLYLDIETDSNYTINTLGLSSDTTCVVIPTITHEYKPAYDFLILGKVFRRLQRLFLNPKITVIIHNSLFDLSVLAMMYNIQPPANVFDTMLAQHRCYPETEKSLGHAISMWTCDQFHKDEGVFEPHNYNQALQLWKYNAKDLLGMRKVYLAQLAYAGFDRGLMASIMQVNAAIVPYLHNSLLGIAVDTVEVNNIIDTNTRLLKQYERILALLVGNECGHTLLPTSSKSCAKYFHELLGYKVVSRTKTGAPALGEGELYKLKLKHPNNIVIDFCIRWRQLVKESGQIKFKLWTPKGATVTDSTLSTYEKFRATTGWKLSGTKTFRLASAKWLNGYGTNVQNPGKSTMRIFCVDAGKAFVQRDQAGAEALIVAFLARKGNFRELFLNGIKSHNYVALHLYFPIWCKAIPEAITWLTLAPADLKKQPRWPDFLKLIKKDKQRYYIAKKTCHAANYGMREDTFIDAVLKDSGGLIVLSVAEAARFLGTYHSLFPEIQEWHLATQEELKSTRELRNLFGYPRKFYGTFSPKTFMEAYAYKPQSTVGTITNIAFTRIHQRIQSGELDMDLLNNKHDSLLAQTADNPESIQIAAKALGQELEQRLVNEQGEVFFMGSEASYGYNWEEYDENKNPRGMRELKLI